MSRWLVTLSVLASVAALLACPGSARTSEPAKPAPLAIGGLVQEGFTTVDAAPVTVPDPSGGYVILEVIRSADW